MAQTKLPDALSRRHLLEGTLDASKAKSIAEAYLAADREVESVDFLARAGARDALVELRDRACQRGDVFLVRLASRALEEEPLPDLWRQVGEAAIAAGREVDAETAKRLATVHG